MAASDSQLVHAFVQERFVMKQCRIAWKIFTEASQQLIKVMLTTTVRCIFRDEYG
jgi:hypothetical protein